MEYDNFEIGFDFKVLCKSDRLIDGIASLPTVDREKEIILKSAIENALEGFMELPVLHLQHTERSIGLVTKAELRPEGLYIRAVIREKNGSDDVWRGIESGKYGKYSVYGRRVKYTPECRLSPHIRTEDKPCITKAMYLDSISVVETATAVNQGTWLNVVKALVDEQENYLNSQWSNKSLIQNENSDYNRGKHMESENVNPVEESEVMDETPVEKAEVEVQTPDIPTVDTADSMGEFRGMLTEIQKSLNSLVIKCNDTVEETVQKAELDTDIETIVKARVNAEVEVIRKAFDDKITELTARIEKMENETIQKGGAPVIIASEFEMPSGFGNASALRKFDEVR